MPLTCYSYAAMPEILQLLTDQPGDLLQQQASVRWMQQHGGGVPLQFGPGGGGGGRGGGDLQPGPLIQGLAMAGQGAGDVLQSPGQQLPQPVAEACAQGGGEAKVQVLYPAAATAATAAVGALQPGDGDGGVDGCVRGVGSRVSASGRREGEVMVEIRFDPGPGSWPRQAPPLIPHRLTTPADPQVQLWHVGG